MSSEKITVQATIQAPRNKVWNYYTQPQHIIKWNFAHPSWHCPYAENDMRVGGTYLARMEARDGIAGFDFEAVYLEIQPGERFTYVFGGREATVTFKENGNNTEVIITFDPETENPTDMQKAGWQAILNNFKAYTESIKKDQKSST